MKLLVTGAGGQLGAELQKQLLSGKSPLGALPEIFRDAEISAADIDTFDVADREAVKKFVGGIKPDIVINCAAFTNVDACEEQPELAERVNGRAPGFLAEAAAENGARMIHISTDYVFAGDDPFPRDEDDPAEPKTVYGKSKLAGEKAVFTAHPAAAVVRTAWLYGYQGKNFVKTILGAAKKRGEVRVVSDQFGNPTSAADLAHHLLKLAAADAAGVFHCTNRGICSWYDFAAECIRLAGISAAVLPCTTAEYPAKTPRPAYSALRNRRLAETVGDKMRPWREAIAEFIANLGEDSY